MRTPLSRPFLILCGILYLGFGLAVLLAPQVVFDTRWETSYPGFLNDVSGSHGGLNVTAGLFLIYAAFSGPWHRAGVLLVALMNAGYLGGRLMTTVEGASASVLTPAAMALEAALLAMALFLACGVSRAPDVSRSRSSGPSRRASSPTRLV